MSVHVFVMQCAFPKAVGEDSAAWFLWGLPLSLPQTHCMYSTWQIGSFTLTSILQGYTACQSNWCTLHNRYAFWAKEKKRKSSWILYHYWSSSNMNQWGGCNGYMPFQHLGGATNHLAVTLYNSSRSSYIIIMGQESIPWHWHSDSVASIGAWLQYKYTIISCQCKASYRLTN